MRSIIVDYVRERDALKRGGGQEHVTLITDIAGESLDAEALMSVHQAMERLRGIDPRCHDIVELRYFAGLSIAECAELLELSPATVSRDWDKARLFLAAELAPD
jgi:RNA polymerase sigma factor (TIGR02999 family)